MRVFVVAVPTKEGRQIARRSDIIARRVPKNAVVEALTLESPEMFEFDLHFESESDAEDTLAYALPR